MSKIAYLKCDTGEKFRCLVSLAAVPHLEVKGNLLPITHAIRKFLNEHKVPAHQVPSLVFTVDANSDEGTVTVQFPDLSDVLAPNESPSQSPAAKKLVLSPSSAAVASDGSSEKSVSKRSLDVCFSQSGMKPLPSSPLADEEDSEMEDAGPLVKQRLNKAFIGDLDGTITSDQVGEYLNGAAWDFGIILEPDVAVLDVQYIDEEPFRKGFQIEFVNEFITRRICNLEDLAICDQNIYLSQEQAVFRDKGVPSAFVTASKLPDFFYKPHFIDFVNSTAWLLEVCQDNEKVVKGVESVDGEKMCRIEFMSADFATIIVKKGLIYDGCKLHLVQEMRPANALSPTSFVKISNLPIFFHEPHFKHFMKGRLHSAVDVILQIKNYSAADRTCIAEFADVKWASKVCEEELIYDMQKLVLVQEMAGDPKTPQGTTTVRVKNLPKFFHEVHFENFLKKIGLLYSLDNTVVKDVTSYNEQKNTCIVEFASAEIASAFVGFKPFVYGNALIRLDFIDTLAIQDDEDKDWCDDPANATEVAEMNRLDTPSKGDSLKGEHATKLLLEACKEHINKKTKKFVGTTDVFDAVSETLRLVHNMKVFVVQCSDRYRSLSRYYSDEKKSGTSKWVHFNDMAILKGDPVVSKSKSPQKKLVSPKKVIVTKAKNLKYKPGGKLNNKKNSNGNNEIVKWTYEAVCLLIHLRKTLQPKFDSSTFRNGALWEEISLGLKTAGHGEINPKQCEDKISRLVDEYKTYREIKKKTGNNTPSFHFLQEMEAFIGEWVTVEPDITFSFGCYSAVGGRKSNLINKFDEDEQD